VNRRSFITLLGGAAAALPLAARAQQVMAAVGFLSLQSRGPATQLLEAFRRGLAETGYIEGQSSTSSIVWPSAKRCIVQSMSCIAPLPSSSGESCLNGENAMSESKRDLWRRSRLLLRNTG
jgi:hypothetical protein